jgi:predicted phosphatase
MKCLLDNVMISHCTWYGNEKIIGYLEFDGKVGYYQIDLNTHQVSPLNIKGISSIGDGHPSIYNQQMVFDSYPDKGRMKDLFLFDLKTEKFQKAGEFLEPIKYYEDTRCDLHPCWNFTGDKLFINSAHEGRRFLYQIDLSQKG